VIPTSPTKIFPHRHSNKTTAKAKQQISQAQKSQAKTYFPRAQQSVSPVATAPTKKCKSQTGSPKSPTPTKKWASAKRNTNNLQRGLDKMLPLSPQPKQKSAKAQKGSPKQNTKTPTGNELHKPDTKQEN
jgi:hypothetical protein